MKLCLRLCGLVGILLVSSPTASLAADQQTPANLHKVTVGLIYIAADAGIFIAKEKGYFAEQGIEVDLNRFTSGGDQIPLLATDKLDVGSGGSTPGLFNAYVRGFDVPIVTSKAIISPDLSGGNVLMVRKDLFESGVKSAAALKGLRIAVNNIQSPSLNYVARGLAAGGLTKDDVTVVEMPFDQFIPALQKKAVDVVLPFSPLAETIGDKLKLAVPVPDTDLGKTSANDTANMMFFSPGFMKSGLATGFMIAHLKAQREYKRAVFDGTGDRNEICGIIHKYIAFVPPDCSGLAMTAIDPDGAVNIPSLERYQADWVKWGMMREPADIRAHVNMSYVSAAVEKLGKYQK
jgi:NitT/TauT family transport system substrate-binding protein